MDPVQEWGPAGCVLQVQQEIQMLKSSERKKRSRAGWAAQSPSSRTKISDMSWPAGLFHALVAVDGINEDDLQHQPRVVC